MTREKGSIMLHPHVMEMGGNQKDPNTRKVGKCVSGVSIHKNKKNDTHELD